MSEAELIEQAASRWLIARDAATPTPEDEAEFTRWIQADIRHRVAYLRLEATWKRSDRLGELRPLDRAADPDLLREQPARRRWPLALAASLGFAVVGGAAWFVHANHGWERYETPVGGFARIVLGDGSVVDLNTDSDLRVRLGDGMREVRLLRGEGRFQVAHEPERPFEVTAGDAAVRAVGTEFSVRLRGAAEIEVLVSEGAVSVNSPQAAHGPPVQAGEAALLRSDSLSVTRVEPQLLARRFAWTSGQLQFRGESLADAVEEFNRYNRRQLRLAAPALGELRVGGTFNATDPESFAAALASTFGVKVDAIHPDAIVLKPP